MHPLPPHIISFFWLRGKKKERNKAKERKPRNQKQSLNSTQGKITHFVQTARTSEGRKAKREFLPVDPFNASEQENFALSLFR